MTLSTSPENPHAMQRPAVGGRAQTWLAVGALIVVTLAFYHGLWLPDLVLIKRDAFLIHLPIKQYMMERLAAGELAQWFPYEALGRPFIGVVVTGVFHPFTLLYFLLPVHDAYRASALLSCLLAALGAFALGRMLALSRTGALVAGLSFTLSGYLVSALDNIQYLYPFCVLPLFIAAVEKTLRDGRGWVVAPAVIWATVFLNGDVQTGYYFVFIALLWTVARADGSYREAGLRFVLIGVLAALLAGIQLAPAGVVFWGSDRAQPAQFHDEAVQLATHPLRLFTILASPIIEKAVPVVVARVFHGMPQWGLWTNSLYLGVPVIGLAFLGAWQRRDLRVLALLACLALVLSLGRLGGLYDAFYHLVPLWSAFRYPEKLMGPFSFAMAMLAGAGLDAVRARKGYRAPWLVGAILCACAGLIFRAEAISAWTAARFEASPALAHEMTDATAYAFFFSAIASLGMWLVITGAAKGWLREALFLATLPAIITLDLAHANMKVYDTAPAEAASFEPALVRVLRAREAPLMPGRFRLVTILDSKSVVPKRIFRLLGYESDQVMGRQALYPEHNAEFHLEAVDGHLPGYSAARNAMLPKRIGPEVAGRFNVTYYIGRRSYLHSPQFANSLVAVVPEYDLALYQNPAPSKPRAYLSRRPEGTASPVDPATLTARADFQSGEVDVIETSAVTLPGPARAGTAVIERYAPEEVRVRVETPQPAVLILLDAFDQGWTATLENGAEMPILRANVLVRAVVVPVGVHTVTFRYETPLLRVGAAASLAGTLLCLGLIIYGRWRGRAALTAP
jgi:membrane protein YfhO